MNYLLVFLGGGLGSLIRYFINKLIPQDFTNFPFATFCSNVLSCFIFGITIAFFVRGNINEAQKLFITTGLCGGFSTFSAFSFESLQLLQEGNILIFVANVVLSIIVCLLALYIGVKLV